MARMRMFRGGPQVTVLLQERSTGPNHNQACQETKRRWFNSANPIQESATSNYRFFYTFSPAKERIITETAAETKQCYPIKFLVLTKRTVINGDPDGSTM